LFLPGARRCRNSLALGPAYEMRSLNSLLTEH
jgi:hypothetical protein